VKPLFINQCQLQLPPNIC